MNMHESKSGSFESSLQNQFEMQSCKLNESTSKSNITLKKMGHELDKAETKCFTLKSELNYMMGVCRKAQTEMKESKGSTNIALESTMPSSKNPNFISPIEFDRDNEITVTNRNLNYNIFQRIHNTEQKTEENFDALHLSPRSVQLLSRKSIDNDDIVEKSGSIKEDKQKRSLNVAIAPRTRLDKKFPPVMTMPIQHETVKASGEYENSPFSLPEYMREHLQSLLSAEGSIEAGMMSKADEGYFCAMPSSAKRDVRGPELNLDIPNTAKAKRRERSKRGSRMERSESSICKMSDITSKTRKRKGKLRSSISKSTVTTRDTNLFSRKETKKRRHKGHGVINQQFNPSKHLKKSNDVVEIFHNTTLKSSNSVMSNKHSKLNRSVNNVKRQRPAVIANRKIQKTLCSENINPEYHSRNEKNEQNRCLQTLNYQSDSRMIPENVREQDKSEKNSNILCPAAQYKVQQFEHVTNRHDDPMFVPSYEMPTLSSKLKRSNRSFFSRFNFHNIPFVVGTSVTPSHNLGLNIQQVLSMMKTRQPIANDVTPLLIRKVSRGMKPVSSLLGQIGGHRERSILDVSSQMAGMFNTGESVKRDKKLSTLDSRHVLCKEQGGSYDRKIKPQSTSAINKNNMTTNARNQQRISRVSLSKEDNVRDRKMRIPDSHNAKEIRNTLINLHDQFEEMNTKYEKLQLEMEKSNDKSLSKELSALEKELNVKEEEINAVVGLYKEVRTLKQQMKTLHEKNSLVCIATEAVKETDKNPFSASFTSEKSNVINPTQILGRRPCNATREPPTSMQLAALLRQIQTFHKQLQLVS